jgi:hypothetical protein
MALSKSLTQIFRKNLLLVGSGFRAAFAPWDYQAQLTSPTSGGPNILDLEQEGPFDTNSLPTGWADTGWMKEYRITPQTRVGQVRSGYRGAVRAQYRGQVGEQFEFKFREYGRLQYKLSTGVQVYNLLKTNAVSPSATSPLGSAGQPAVSMSSYSAGPPATLTVASASGFAANDYIVCDQDFTALSSGVLGSNGAFAFPGAVTDTDWIRKTSDFVARIASISGNVLTLDQPFVGGGSPAATNGTPPAGSKVQKIIGWSAREGGTFIQEWSGLFLADTIDGAQIAIYYPHISINQFRGHNPWTLENAGTTDLGGMELDAMFEALAYDDPLDGETICNYGAFYPSARIQNLY